MEALSILIKQPTINILEQQILDKKYSLPPNQLVTKEYAPDVKPVMKLITLEEMQQNQKNLSYKPPKIKNQQFLKYAKNFSPSDFVGYHYAQKLDQMVYFRYNNQDYNQYIDTNGQKGTRYFGGLFIPLTALQSKQFKVENNIYSALNLTVPEIKDTAALSFSKNSKGCSFDPLFSSNFSSGNMMAAIRKNPFQYDIIIQNDTNSKASEWFNFAVKFIEEGNYKFNIVNLSHQNPLYNYGMKVPYYSFFQQSMRTQTLQAVKSGQGWQFVGKNVTFSKSQLRKEKQHFDQTYYCLSFEYKCKNRHDIVIFANAIPYTLIDYERFLSRALYNKIGQHMKMQKLEVCQTLSGTTLSAYLFYHRKSKSNTVLLRSISPERSFQNQRSSVKHKTLNLSTSQNSASALNSSITESSSSTKTIVIMTRQHPGQTSGSYLLEGVIQFLMDNTQFDVFKKNFQFVIIPFVNPDGVKYGNQRVNLTGSDLEKSWKNPDQIFEPEVYHVKKLLKSINQMHPITLILNLSSSNQNVSSFFRSNSNRKYCEQIPQLFPYLMSKRVPQISFQDSQFSNIDKSHWVSTLSNVFPKSLVYDLKTSLYGWKSEILRSQKLGQSIQQQDQQYLIKQFTHEIYRNMGKQLISAYLDYVRLCSKNIGIQERWLKEIEQLSLKRNPLTKQINVNQQKYEESWERDLIKFNFSLYNPPKVDSQRKQGGKHKTLMPNHQNNENLHSFRSKTKKLTMSFLKNRTSFKDEKQNSILETPNMTSSADLMENIKNKSSMGSLIGQPMKSPISSSLFSPKHKNDIIKQISQSIKESNERQSPTLGHHIKRPPTNLLGILQHNQKKLPGLIRKKSELTFSDKIQIKDLESRDKNKEGFVKFQSIKRSIPTLGVKPQFKQFGRA